MIQYTLNGKTVNVKPEHEQHFLKNNPTAVKKTSWIKGEEGLIPDELEFWKKRTPVAPGKPQEAGQPQTTQQPDTEPSSEVGSSASKKTFILNNNKIHVKQADIAQFKRSNPSAEEHKPNVFEKANTAFNTWWDSTYVGAAILRGDVQAYFTGEAGELM